MYYGIDNKENLRVAFSDFGAEIDAIKSLPVPVTDDPNGDVREIPVEFFLIGDTIILGKALGHMGSKSLYSCLFCLIPGKALKRAGDWDDKKKYADRTIDGYIRAAQLCEPDGAKRKAQTETKRRQQSERTNSVDEAPLFHIPIPNISPPQLHIALGIGKRFYKSLEECCWKHDELNAGLTSVVNPTKEVAQLNKDI
uniref:Uncharacterized protein n=1 Tax=Plectus sambesii TaxID=2011161 RepID=A0A914WYH2_9BILA